MACLSGGELELVDPGPELTLFGFPVNAENDPLGGGGIVPPGNVYVVTIGLSQTFNSVHEAIPFLVG